MATTTNYGWTTPDDTALVKDGASAIRSLGTSIDTAMNTALGTKKAGMVLLNTTSFSGVSSQALTSQFSSTYDNYVVVLDINSVATTGVVYCKYRVGTTDSSASYTWAYGGTNESSAAVNEAGTAVTTGFQVMRISNVVSFHLYSSVINLNSPFTTQVTAHTLQSSTISAASSFSQATSAGFHNVLTSYDGINFIFPGVTSGTISLYGRNK